jgi:precorrin-6B methylase 2
MVAVMTSRRPAPETTARSRAHAGATTLAETTADEIAPGQSVELLKELHILTRDGKLNQDSRRKLKQVRHLAHFIEPLLVEAAQAHPDVTLVDHGAGKSYLGFILYDLFLKDAGNASRVYGVEVRQELVERSAALARRLGFDRMQFIHATAADAIASALLPERVDIVTALHACDTATDDAIAFALAKSARFVVVAPCCQAEVASVLRQHKRPAGAEPLAELWRHPLHTREFGSQVTNVLRALELEAHGYRVSVTELVGWEHSMKNELIVARRLDQKNPRAARRLEELLTTLGLESLRERFNAVSTS